MEDLKEALCSREAENKVQMTKGNTGIEIL